MVIFSVLAVLLPLSGWLNSAALQSSYAANISLPGEAPARVQLPGTPTPGLRIPAWLAALNQKVYLPLTTFKKDAATPPPPEPTDPSIPTPVPITPPPFPDDMIAIPAGSFQMGCPPGNANCQANENPLHTVTLSAYKIDKFEVTNARYNACVSAGKCTVAHYTSTDPNSLTFPVTGVDWAQASAFCAWDGKRLPTEAEWEMAARGASDTRTYPWGDTAPTCTLGNFFLTSACVGAPMPVGSYVQGISAMGLFEMAGNAWEWVSDWYQGDYYSSQATWNNPTGPASGTARVLRGGSWQDNWAGQWRNYRVSFRGSDAPASWKIDYGFRCARTGTAASR